MSSGKSDPWCDANRSCLRISTPQKPWSPTAELKTCWPPTMDSRSHHLLALGSTNPPTLYSHGHLLCPGARVTLAIQAGLSIPSRQSPPPEYLVFLIPAAPAQKTCIHLPPISAFSGFFFFFLYLKRSSSICVWLLDLYFLIIFLICSPSILLSRHGALTVNVEPESTDSTTQVLHSFLQMCSQWMDTEN